MTTAEPSPVARSCCITVGHETLESLKALFRESEPNLNWSSPFILPGWIRAWRQAFAPKGTPWILSFRDHDRLIGVAPLLRDETTARFIGSADVCDYFDLVTDPGRSVEFCSALLEAARHEGLNRLDLGPVRPDSAVMTGLVPEALRKGFPAAVTKEDLLFELDLPASWESYLGLLDGKQRHEIRRKLRRLEQIAPFAFRLVSGPTEAAMDRFMGLFRQNRPDKAEFMNAGMEGFFRLLAELLPETRIGFLDVDAVPAAAIMCFDHRGTRYLYNSGFDAAIRHLSVGILCKVLSIRDAIARGVKRYDFLKGDETYKRHIGGRPVALYRCRIDLPE